MLSYLTTKYEKKSLEYILINLGLTEYEARVYLATLSLGISTVAQIAKTAEMKRTTVYAVVGSLKQKGLIFVEVKGFKQKFVAEHPEKLEAILETRRMFLQKMMPEFEALYNLKGGESSIKYYEGLNGIKSVYEGLLEDVKTHEDYLIIANHEQWLNLDPEFFFDFTKRRAKLPINIRLLVQDSPRARETKQFEKNINAKIKFLPAGTSLNTNLVVIPQKVVIHQLVPPVMAIVIENPSVVRMHQEMFEIIWRSLPE